MAKFKFRLETLVRIREAVRDRCRLHLAEAYRAASLLEERKRLLEEHLADMRRRSRQAAGPGEINVDRLVEARRFEAVLQAQRQFAGQKEEELRAIIEARRQALVVANREVQVLENLRARQLERHRAEENRRDIKQLDEVAQQRAIREECL
jgi:flagellar protein FliJ